MTETDPHTLAAPYALDALDDVERRAFERHLRECEACRLDVAGFEGVATRLASVEAAEPPAGMRSSVLAEVARTPQMGGIPQAARPAQGRPAKASHRPLERLLVPVAACLALLTIGLGVVSVQSRARVAELEQQAAEADDLGDVLSAPDARLISAEGASLVVSAAAGEAVFAAHGLEPLDAEQVYTLWVLSDGSPTAMAEFVPELDGSAVQRFPLASAAADAVAVTVEQPGATAPTSDPVRVAALS